MRIGYGWDSHVFEKDLPLKIGGVLLPHHSGLSGHSDGDVLLHALTDALLGAISSGDIGTYFPSGDERWKGADSVVFIQEAVRRVERAGYVICNVDSTLILKEPRIVPFVPRLKVRLAALLNTPADNISVKAKTPEGMGTDNAAIAHVVVLLQKREARPGRKALKAAVRRPRKRAKPMKR